ncbi:DUF1254 domain-containing protein [Parvularcula marina]|uniref:DUF1254 domain-containing protein n=1 Tax=Parvularcula marina TaxID=2292771 RepID=A0A371RFM4_9PROT|nr:DUF1254 domain-containing protein [Parvularcula marina]RFB04259.1 DUF1254 domain-containing protein [Parvularcula marina]
MKYSFWIATGVVAILGALIGYQYELRQIPIQEMEEAEAGIASRAKGLNAMVHAPRPSAASRTVVRPSPDQLYSACVYDLKAGPVVFEGTAPDDSYWSLSFFAHNSDNFFVVNDSELEEKAFRFVLIGQGDKMPDGVPESQIVRSPSQTGIVLQRIFIATEDQAGPLDETRRSTNCHPMSA